MRKFLTSTLALTMLLGGMALSDTNVKATTEEVGFTPLPQTPRTIFNWYR